MLSLNTPDQIEDDNAMDEDDPFVDLPFVETRKVQVKGRPFETPPTPVIETFLSTFGTVRTK